MNLTPEQRQQIYLEEKARIEAQEQAAVNSLIPEQRQQIYLAEKARQEPQLLTFTGAPRKPGSGILRVLGAVIMMLGLFDVLYFTYVFDPSVTVPRQTIGGMEIGGQRVVNIGLIEQKRSMANGGIVTAVIGGLLVYIGRRQD